MKTKLIALAILLGLPVTAQAKLQVVATTPDLGAVAREVGGDGVEVASLAKPTEDPHFVDARPSFIVKLNRADVLLEGGAELEIGWLSALLQSSRNPRIAVGAPGRIQCHEGVQLLEVPATLDRSQGDIHAAGNPHYMTDPVNARIVAVHITDAFCRLEPRSVDIYRANLKRFIGQLDAKLAEWQKLLVPFRGQHVVAYHNSWPYFAHRFGLKIEMFLEPKPGLPTTPAHLAAVMARMKQENARAVIVEPYLDRRTAETVARSTGATVVDVAYLPGGVKGTEDSYIKLMDYLVSALARALAGNTR
jgi:zinc/manganese transport system substrate-binding protein